MKEITLDITTFEEKISLHRYLKETLDFPFYYGANLDALFDELTSETTPHRITIIYPKKPQGMMVDYLPRILNVFHDAARDNYHLEMIYQEA